MDGAFDATVLGGSVSWVVAWARRLRRLKAWQLLLLIVVTSLLLVVLFEYWREAWRIVSGTMTVAQSAAGIDRTLRKKADD